MSELAGYMYNFTSVPLYDTLGVSAIEFIVNQTEMETVIASADKAWILLNIKATLPTVKNIIVMGLLEESLVFEGKRLDVNIVAWTEVERNGLDKPVSVNPPSPDDGNSLVRNDAIVSVTSCATGTLIRIAKLTYPSLFFSLR